MPKIPGYERQAKMPGSTNPYLENPEAQGKVGRALQGAGRDLLERALEKQAEQDELDALEATSDLSDYARSLEMEQEKRRGKSAEGVTKDTGIAIDERINEISGKLNPRASIIFKKRASTVRAGTMDSMAGHEAREHQARRDRALKVITDTWRQTAIGGEQTKASLDAAIFEMKDVVENVYQGYDQEFRDIVKEAAEDDMTKTWLIERARRHPALMLKELESYKKHIPAAEYEQVKAYLKSVVQDELVRDRYLEIKGTHGDDYQGMLDEASKIKNETMREGVTREIKSDWATTKEMNDHALRKKREQILQGVIDLWDNKKYKEVHDVLKKHRFTLTPEQSEHWLAKLEAMTEEKLQGIQNKNSKYNIDNDNIKGAMRKMIDLHPNRVEVDDIYRMLGEGISSNTAAAMKSRLIKNKKSVPPQLQRAYEMINQWFKQQQFEGGEGVSGFQKDQALKLYNRLWKWSDRFPDSDPVEDFLIPYRDQLLKGEFEQSFTEYRKANAPQGRYDAVRGRVTQKMPPRLKADQETGFDEDSFYENWLGKERATGDWKVIEPEMPKKKKQEVTEKEKKKQKRESVKKIASEAFGNIPIAGPFLRGIISGVGDKTIEVIEDAEEQQGGR